MLAKRDFLGTMELLSLRMTCTYQLVNTPALGDSCMRGVLKYIDKNLEFECKSTNDMVILGAL